MRPDLAWPARTAACALTRMPRTRGWVRGCPCVCFPVACVIRMTEHLPSPAHRCQPQRRCPGAGLVCAFSQQPQAAFDDADFQAWLAVDPDHRAAFERWQADWRRLDTLPDTAVQQLRRQLAADKAADLLGQRAQPRPAPLSSQPGQHGPLRWPGCAAARPPCPVPRWRPPCSWWPVARAAWPGSIGRAGPCLSRTTPPGAASS